MSYLTKQELRKSIRKVLRSISPEVRRYQSNNIFERLQQVLEYQRAKSVGLFLSMKTEVETRPIMEDCFSHGRTVVVPKIISDCEFEWVSLDSTSRLDSLPKDKWGIPIPEYNDANRLLLHPEFTPDVIIVPGVAFDAKCQRLGHGKGYYDRSFAFLKQWCLNNEKAYPLLIGISFEEQIVDSVPCSEYDVPLDKVITPSITYSA